MATPLTNTELAEAEGDLFAQLIAGTITLAAFKTARAAQLDRAFRGGAAVSRAVAVSTEAISGLSGYVADAITWQAGVAGGGPGGDGKYPLRDKVGNVSLVTAPAALNAELRTSTYQARSNLVRREKVRANAVAVVEDMTWGSSGWGIRLKANPAATVAAVDFSPALAAGTAYSMSFQARTVGVASAVMAADFYPDTLPGDQAFTVTTTPGRFVWENVSSTSSDMATAVVRLFSFLTGEQEIEITDLKLEVGTTATAWRPPEMEGSVAKQDFSNVGDGTLTLVPNFQSSGSLALTAAKKLSFLRGGAASAKDECDFQFARQAEYVGGSGGGDGGDGGSGGGPTVEVDVNVLLRVAVKVGLFALANEWTLQPLLENWAPVGSENCAGYPVAIKNVRPDGTHTGATIGWVAEVKCLKANPTTSSVGGEFDVTGIGGDINGTRAGIHSLIRTGDGEPMEAKCAYYATPYVNAHIKTGLLFEAFGGSFGDLIKWAPSGNSVVTLSSLGNLHLAGRASADSLRINRSTASVPSQKALVFAVDDTDRAFIWHDQYDRLNLTSQRSSDGHTFGVAVHGDAGAFLSRDDNDMDLGHPTARWKNSFFSVSPTITSDQAMKTPLRAFTDAELDAIGSVSLGIYQWLDAVAEKGEDHARLHAGAIVQDVIAAFEAVGLDPFRYAPICEDPALDDIIEYETVEVQDTIWLPDTIEIIDTSGDTATVRNEIGAKQEPKTREVPVFNEDGTPAMVPMRAAITRKVPTGETRLNDDGEPVPVYATIELAPAIPAFQKTISIPVMTTEQRPVTRRVPRIVDGVPVTVLGLRYDQVSIMLHAWSRRELARLDQRLTALEDLSAS